GDVLDDQAEAAGALPAAQRTRDVVAAEAERRDGRVDLLGRVRAHSHLAVDDAGDGLETHARVPGDITHGRPHGLPRERTGRELTTVRQEATTLSSHFGGPGVKPVRRTPGTALRADGGRAAWP